MRRVAVSLGLLLLGGVEASGEIRFSSTPAAARADDGVKISFAVSAPTDVEVAILDPEGTVVRHLAAGALRRAQDAGTARLSSPKSELVEGAGVPGAEKAPPAPFRQGLSQELTWDLRDDFGRPAEGGPFTVRVRAGMGARFGRLIGGDPCTFGALHGVACDEDGTVYVLGGRGIVNQGHLTLRVFDPEGRYLREIMPFPADLAPDAMKDVARWDEERKAFRPRNLKNLNPDFYGVPGKWGGTLSLVSASAEGGVRLTDGTRLFTLETTGAVRGPKFTTRVLWDRKMIPWGHVANSGGGPVHLAASPDGKYIYLAGVYTARTKYGHKMKPELPPGRIFRAPADGAAGTSGSAPGRTEGPGTMEEFVTIEVAHEEGVGGRWFERLRRSGNFTAPKGPVHGIAVDREGRVYVCDREHDRVAVFDESGGPVAELPVGWPDLVAVHPRTGAVYVTTRDCVAYHRYEKLLLKFESLEDEEPAARYDLGPAGDRPAMALWAGEEKTVVWVVGVEGETPRPGGIVALEDKGGTFEPLKTHFSPKEGAQLDWNRIAVDYDRDEVYVSDGATRIWRYDGRTGEGGLVRKNEKPFLASDLAVGYDGLLYVRVSNAQVGKGSDYSGPFWRLDRDLDPAPYPETGTHVLSDYIYSRYGVGYAERGIGAGPKGEVYLSFMYRWVNYMIGGFDPEGRPIKGKYLEGEVQPDNFKRGQNRDLTSAVIGPIIAANGGIRVDLAGNIYVGLWVRPKEASPPEGFEDAEAFRHSVGSVVKFTPEGGSMAADKAGGGADGADVVQARAGAVGLAMESAKGGGLFVEGAVAAYPGLAPFSHAGFGGNTCCVCRVPRFDVDRYGRVVMPNAITNSVLVVDNAGNRILEFGRYGNFDSQFVNPLDGGAKPSVEVPDIPLGWPTGAGVSEERSGFHLYVNDTLNRRVVRVDATWAAEETCAIDSAVRASDGEGR